MTFTVFYKDQVFHGETWEDWLRSPDGILWIVYRTNKGVVEAPLYDHNYYHGVQDKAGNFRLWQTNDTGAWLRDLGLPEHLEQTDYKKFLSIGGRSGLTATDEEFEATRPLVEAEQNRLRSIIDIPA